MQTQITIMDSVGLLIKMASSHIDDIESGLEDGIYSPEDNDDLDAKREAVKVIEANLENLAEVSKSGMYTELYGHSVPVTIAYGLVHQVVREYDSAEIDGVKYLGGTTTFDPKTKESYPWFQDLRAAIEYLIKAEFAGYVQTYVAEADGSGPSWITAGVYYRKTSGSRKL